MKTKLICTSLLCIFLNNMLSAQEIPDRLKPYVFYTYFSVEYMWYGEPFKFNETIMSRYRIVSRIDDGVRFIFVEKLDYVLKAGKFSDSPENAKLVSFMSCDEEDFRGIDTPSVPKTPIEVEKWQSYDCVILKVGKSRYSINFCEFPVSIETHAIDNEGKNVDLLPDY